MQFVIRWSLMRGVLDVPELLDANGQVLARAQKDKDDTAEGDNRVVWRDGFGMRRPPRPVSVADVAWAKQILARAAAGD